MVNIARFGKKTEIDGIRFDSESEALFYLKLKKFKKHGKIKDFRIKNQYILQEDFTTEYNSRFDNVKLDPITYNPDFWVLLNDDNEVLIDTKGGSGACNEEEAKLKRKALLYQNKKLPVIFISQLPIYLCGNKDTWVENTNGRDFHAKLKNKYQKLYPAAKGKRIKPVNWKVDNWDEYFEYEDIDGLFYVWKATKKVKKK